jgi:hypothetical protein
MIIIDGTIVVNDSDNFLLLLYKPRGLTDLRTQFRNAA